jgi:type I restriction enzyme M protein
LALSASGPHINFSFIASDTGRMIFNAILKDSIYHLTQFRAKQIQNTEKAVITRTDKKGTPVYYITCPIRKKEIKLGPEEVIRQLYLRKLMGEYGYESALFAIESEVTMGSSGKRADIVVYEKKCPAQPYIIVELKSPSNPTAKAGKKQLESYCKFSGASIGVWTDGNDVEYYYSEQDKRSKTTYLNKLSRLSNANETLLEVLQGPYTIKQLYENDRLQKNH